MRLTPAQRREPPCTRYDPQLFDSTKPRDHLKAREICAACPLVQECVELATSISSRYADTSMCRGPDGTWAGLLWRHGEVVPSPPRHGCTLARQDAENEERWLQRMSRVDGCPACCTNTEAPQRISEKPDGDFRADYRCGACGHSWYTTWKDNA